LPKIAEIVLCCLLHEGQLFASQVFASQKMLGSQKKYPSFSIANFGSAGNFGTSKIRAIRVHPW
jgi:hypothetical protein